MDFSYQVSGSRFSMKLNFYRTCFFIPQMSLRGLSSEVENQKQSSEMKANENNEDSEITVNEAGGDNGGKMVEI